MENTKLSFEVEVPPGLPPIVRLCGEVDFHSKDQVCEVFDRLFEDGHSCIHADLTDLFYIDSSGLSALVGCAVKATKTGGSIKLLGVNDRVSRLLTLCGAAPFFASPETDMALNYSPNSNAPSQSFWHVSDFSLPSVPGAAAVARGRLSEVIRSLPLSLADGQDVLLAAGEALANAIKHGCKCDPDQRINVRCVAGPGKLAIDIIDTGLGFDPSLVALPTPHSLTEGGMGIYVMRELMDEVSFSFADGNTKVQLVKYIRCPKADNVSGPLTPALSRPAGEEAEDGATLLA